MQPGGQLLLLICQPSNSGHPNLQSPRSQKMKRPQLGAEGFNERPMRGMRASK